VLNHADSACRELEEKIKVFEKEEKDPSFTMSGTSFIRYFLKKC
jgi:hypothetical protein